jgi:hypothetical protein
LNKLNKRKIKLQVAFYIGTIIKLTPNMQTIKL